METRYDLVNNIFSTVIYDFFPTINKQSLNVAVYFFHSKKVEPKIKVFDLFPWNKGGQNSLVITPQLFTQFSC